MTKWLRRYRSQVDKKTRKAISDWSLLFFLVGCLDIIVLFQEEGTRLYYKGNNALLLVVILCGLVFIAVGKSLVDMARSFASLVQKRRQVDPLEMPGALMFLTLSLLTASVLFILDLSFIKSYGVRISAVIGVILFKIIRDLISKYRYG